MYQIKRYPILNLLLNHKYLIIVLTAMYILAWSVYISKYGLTSKLADDEFVFLIRFFGYPLLLIFLHENINDSLGNTWGMYMFGGLSNKESWWGILGTVPIIGTIPITIRIYQKLVELEKEMKKQGVTNLIDFKPLKVKK
jgi:hypothetical protein